MVFPKVSPGEPKTIHSDVMLNHSYLMEKVWGGLKKEVILVTDREYKSGGLQKTFCFNRVLIPPENFRVLPDHQYGLPREAPRRTVGRLI